ncbi:MAG: 3-hydroxyacyl-CoA dehydrogenase/enoyl-CoA hydratase family protein [Myxococcota bacterium]
MASSIRKAAVLGAGVMGSGIAAHLASCGIRTLLLDIVPPGCDDPSSEARNRFSAGGLKAALKSKPAAFLRKERAGLIEVGNFDDDMGKLSECDWIIEVVKEDMGIKRSLLASIEANWTPGTIVTTNTSGLSIDGMLEGRSDDFKRHFLGTHFFNPVRYMHLLEIIPGPDTDPAIVCQMANFCDRYLGKGIVYAKDTPNFIANRIGVYAMMTTIHAMRDLGYSLEEVDAIVGKPMGRPKSAAFRTADVVGLDTFVHVAQNCYDALPGDPERDVFQIPDFLTTMVEKKLLGSKTKAGFYKKVGREIQALNLDTFEYQPKVKPDLPALKALKKIDDPGKRTAELIKSDGRAGKFAWHVMSKTLAYAANIAFDIADDIVNIDRAMRWGFNWDQGPFEVWQAIGVAEGAARMRADGIELPAWIDEAAASGGFYADGEAGQTYFADGEGQAAVPQLPGSVNLQILKKAGHVVERNRGATLVDLGDGIACLEFHTKMNTVDPDLTHMLNRACDIVETDFDGLVLGNEAEHFSAGANLMMIVMGANQKKWDDIEALVGNFQAVIQRLKYLPKPVVAAPHGLTLGGGCEMAMAADRMMVDKETYLGLVEVGVGLIPGGCGTLNLLKRLFDGIPASADPRMTDRLPLVQRAFENIGMAKVATGAGEVFSLGYGTAQDEIAMSRDRRIADAKALTRYMAGRGYTPPAPAENLVLPGRSGKAAISLAVYGMMLGGYVSEHDRLIANKLANVLCGGDTDGRTPVSEERVLELELEAFMSLVGEPKSLERMQYTLMNNKPLRN